jgi:hypothetical protein
MTHDEPANCDGAAKVFDSVNRMRRRLALACFLTIVLTTGVPAAAAPGRDPAGLEPGERVVYRVQVPVNLVFVGDGRVDRDAVAAELPAVYEPVVREQVTRGISSRPIGLRYEFDYRFVDAGKPFSDRFFAHLKATGRIGGRTADQQRYNAQQTNRLDVAGDVLYADAPAAERWLNNHGRAALGIDRNAYTIFFVNWYGRPDFQFHVYTRNDGTDPDTGATPPPRELTAWGGDDGRSWFFDPSAGPNAFGGSWNVDDADLTGDGEADYRIPPAWEYHPDGFRDPGLLAGDLGKVARFVAIDQLFTPSPIYEPMVSTPRPGGDKIVHLHLLQEIPGGNGIDLVQRRIIRDRLAALQPYHRWRVHLEQTNPLDADTRRTLEIWAHFWREGTFPDDRSCWEPLGHPAAQLFCFFEANRTRFFPGYGRADYVIPTALIDMSDDLLSLNGGFADHNWRDRTPSYVYITSSPDARAAEGTAFTGYAMHEIGHHIGLSHTYDGWDHERRQQHFAAGDTLFADLGTQAHSVMGLPALPATFDFSRFEYDNLARWDIAGHLNAANALAGPVLDHPRAHTVRQLIEIADREATVAQRRLASWDYQSAARAAHRSLAYLTTAAERLGIEGA